MVFLDNRRFEDKKQGKEKQLINNKILFRIKQGNNMKTLIKTSILFLAFFSFLNTSTKVYAQVSEQWAVRFEAQGKYKNNTHSMAMAISDSGYVYITGSSTNTEGDVSLWHHDYCTIKYNQMGEEEWVVYYNPGNAYYCFSYAITVDSEGNVFITGIIRNSDMESFGTIKYNAAGELQWATNTVFPWADGYPSTPMAIDLDINGNVFIMGNLHGAATDSSFSTRNFITIKYSSAGTELWAQTFNDKWSRDDEVFDMAVGKFGNVYVTGYVSTYLFIDGGALIYTDYITIKYNTDGVEQWVATYNGDKNHDGYAIQTPDEAYALVLDDDENVFITGLSANVNCVTIKYNALGQEQWVTKSYYVNHGSAIVLDGNGNIYVTGNGNDGSWYSEYGTTKINHAGQVEWEKLYKAPGDKDDMANSIAIDDSNNVYVTGVSMGDSSDWDYATVKYNTFGEEQWSFIYNGTGNGTDKPVGIVVDSSYNVYVAGFSMGDTTYNDFVTIKYGLVDSLFPRIETSVSSVNFDSVLVGTEESLSITIYSKGSLSLTISNISINNSAFSTDYTSSVSTIIPGESLVIHVFFTPTSSMDYNGVLTIENNDHPVEVQLSGNGVSTTEIEEKLFSDIPKTFALQSAYPNPFNPSTTIKYSIPKESNVTLKVFDVLGREIKKLVIEELNAGYYQVIFDASHLSSGVYYYQLKAVPIGKHGENFVETKKMVLLR